MLCYHLIKNYLFIFPSSWNKIIKFFSKLGKIHLIMVNLDLKMAWSLLLILNFNQKKIIMLNIH